MASPWEFITDAVKGLISPVAGIFQKREERHQAKDAIHGALVAAQQSDATTVTVNDQHLEALLAESNKTSWKDEYVTLSVVGIINATVLGGILQGFGYPGFMEGVGLGIKGLIEAGIDLPFILNATVMAAIGLNIWRKT